MGQAPEFVKKKFLRVSLAPLSNRTTAPTEPSGIALLRVDRTPKDGDSHSFETRRRSGRILQPSADEGARRRGAAWTTSSWLFYVQLLGKHQTRLISRFRRDSSAELSTRLLFGPTLLEPIGFIMDRRMKRPGRGGRAGGHISPREIA